MSVSHIERWKKVPLRKTQDYFKGTKRAWFILLSILIGLLLALFSGGLHIRRTIGANMPFDEFKAHMDERIPA